MAHEEDTGKSTDELVERAWQIVREADSSVLITVEGDEIHARAMRPRCEQDEHVIRFLTNAGSSKVKTIASGPRRSQGPRHEWAIMPNFPPVDMG